VQGVELYATLTFACLPYSSLLAPHDKNSKTQKRNLQKWKIEKVQKRKNEKREKSKNVRRRRKVKTGNFAQKVASARHGTQAVLVVLDFSPTS
jgi:hypothetical protein